MKYFIVLIIPILSLMSSRTTEGEWLLYSSNLNGNSDIFLMNYNTKEIRQLTSNAMEEWAAVWMNSTEITFFRDNNGLIERVKLNLKTNEESIIDHPANCKLDDKNVLYSPKSDLEVYSCNGKLYLINPQDKSETIIGDNLSGQSAYPSWSNDGRHIIFTNNDKGSNDIYQYNIHTSEVHQLVDFDSNDERGELSPDNAYLAFSSNSLDATNQDILLLELSSGHIQNISKSKGTELIVKWSNDGQHLIYGGDSDGNWELYRYDLKTKSIERLTENMAFDGDPRIFKH